MEAARTSARTWWIRGFMALGISITAAAFIFKLVEFICTLQGSEAEGFAVVPVTNYFIVATGYLLLFLWAYLTGQFRDLEAPKDAMLRREEALDRNDEWH